MTTKRLLPFTLLVLFVVAFTACKKHKSNPADSTGLPPATQTGAKTFGCLVNGEVFVPKRKVGSINPVLQCYYQYLDDDYDKSYFWGLSANHQGKDCELTSISLGTDSLAIVEGKTYQLIRNGRGNASAQYTYYPNCYTLENNYKTNDLTGGELTITYFDEINQIVSGTFWFTAVNDKGDTVRVTDGRFDMPYTR